MADVMRVVEVNPYTGAVTEVLDLQSHDGSGGPGIARERDSFEYTPPQMNAQLTQLGGRFGGQRAVSGKAENGRVAASFLVRGTDVDDALRRAGEAFATVDAALSYPNRYIEWRSLLATDESYFEIRGPGTWAPTYSSVQITQESILTARLEWPCAPYVLGAPREVSAGWATPVHDTIDYGTDWVIDIAGPPAPTFATVGGIGSGWRVSSNDQTLQLRSQGPAAVFAERERMVLKLGMPGQVTAPTWESVICIGLRRVDSLNYVLAELTLGQDTGLEVYAVVGGTRTQIAQCIVWSRPATAANFWLELRIEGNRAAGYLYQSDPELLPAPDPVREPDVQGVIPPSLMVPGTRVVRMLSPAAIPAAERVLVQSVATGLGHHTALVPARFDITDIDGDLAPAVDVRAVTTTGMAPWAWAAFGWNSLLDADAPFGVQNISPGDGWTFSTGAAGGAAMGGQQSGAELYGFDAVSWPITYFTPSTEGEIYAYKGFSDYSLDPDGPTEQITLMEVYAYVRIPETITRPRLIASVRPTAGAELVATLEYGAEGRELPVHATILHQGLFRLGTLPFPSRPIVGAVELRLNWEWSHNRGGTTPMLDYVFLLPSKRSAYGRTGVVLDDYYPRFMPEADAPYVKLVRSQLDGKISATGVTYAPHHGLGGSPIEPEAFRNSGFTIAVLASYSVPDTAVASVNWLGSVADGTLELMIWPRYRYAVHG